MVQKDLLLPIKKTSMFQSEFDFSQFPELREFIKVTASSLWDELHPEFSSGSYDYETIRQLTEAFFQSGGEPVPGWHRVKEIGECLHLTHLGNLSDLNKIKSLNLLVEKFFDFYMLVEEKDLLDHFEEKAKAAS